MTKEHIILTLQFVKCKSNWLHHCNIFLQTFNFRWLKLGYTYGLTYIGQLRTDLKNTPHCTKVTVSACCSGRNDTLICYLSYTMYLYMTQMKRYKIYGKCIIDTDTRYLLKMYLDTRYKILFVSKICI